MDVTFPTYLSSPDFKYRHVKITIMKNAEKTSTPGEMYDTLVAKSKELMGAVASAKGGALSGDTKTVLKTSQKLSSQFKQIMGKGSVALHNLTLPMPNNLVDAASHDWSADKGIIGSIADKLSTGSVAGAVGKGVSVVSDMSGMRKPLADPGYFQNYVGTLPREFNLSFDLIPANTEEASAIYVIINFLKKYSAPSTSTGTGIMLAPHYFKIEFTNPYINTLMRAEDVVLKGISVDYGADGSMQQTPDGIPKYIKLDLTFAERHVMMEEMY